MQSFKCFSRPSPWSERRSSICLPLPEFYRKKYTYFDQGISRQACGEDVIPFLNRLSITMTRLLVDPQEKRVGVTGMSILDCCSMFEGMHGNHTVIICENLEIKSFGLGKGFQHTIGSQEDQWRQNAIRDIMEWRYRIDEVEVVRIIRVSVVARPGISYQRDAQAQKQMVTKSYR